jgi:hypothetical protein
MTMKQSMQVLTSQGSQEWYTPPWIIDLARSVMGEITTDPASADLPQTWIKAETFYTAKQNGLGLPWRGNLWLNPPFEDTKLWVTEAAVAFHTGAIKQAVILVNSAHGYNWYEALWVAFPVCCLRERLRFVNEQGIAGGQAKKGQTLVYMGPNVEAFKAAFGPHGRILLP